MRLPAFELKPQGDALVGTLREFTLALTPGPTHWTFVLYRDKAQIAHGTGPQDGCLRQAAKLVMRESSRTLRAPCKECGEPLYPAPGPVGKSRCLNPDCEQYRKRV